MNLWDLRVNETASIESLSLDTKTKISNVLKDLGLKKNSLVKCLHKTIFNGPRVYEVNGVITCTLCKQGATKVLINQ